MTHQATARDAIEKARYFLTQAETAERDPNISSARLPYVANLEGAIVNARSILLYLNSEFARKSGYRRWRDSEWQRLDAQPLFTFLTDRRDWIVHQGTEKANLTFNVSVAMMVNSNVFFQAKIIRGKPWYKRPFKILWADVRDDWLMHRASRKIMEPAPPPSPPSPPSPTPPIAEQTFYFEDANWRSKPARVYVGEYIDLLEQVVIEAEQKFS